MEGMAGEAKVVGGAECLVAIQVEDGNHSEVVELRQRQAQFKGPGVHWLVTNPDPDWLAAPDR